MRKQPASAAAGRGSDGEPRSEARIDRKHWGRLASSLTPVLGPVNILQVLATGTFGRDKPRTGSTSWPALFDVQIAGAQPGVLPPVAHGQREFAGYCSAAR